MFWLRLTQAVRGALWLAFVAALAYIGWSLGQGRGVGFPEALSVAIALLAIGLERIGHPAGTRPPPSPAFRNAVISSSVHPSRRSLNLKVDVRNSATRPYWLESARLVAPTGEKLAESRDLVQLDPDTKNSVTVNLKTVSLQFKGRDPNASGPVYSSQVLDSHLALLVGHRLELDLRMAAPFDRLVRRITLERWVDPEDPLDLGGTTILKDSQTVRYGSKPVRVRTIAQSTPEAFEEPNLDIGWMSPDQKLKVWKDAITSARRKRIDRANRRQR